MINGLICILQETFTSKIKNVVNENPWIVALMIVVVGLPICVVVYVACCTAPTKKVNFEPILVEFYFCRKTRRSAQYI